MTYEISNKTKILSTYPGSYDLYSKKEDSVLLVLKIRKDIRDYEIYFKNKLRNDFHDFRKQFGENTLCFLLQLLEKSDSLDVFHVLIEYLPQSWSDKVVINILDVFEFKSVHKDRLAILRMIYNVSPNQICNYWHGLQTFEEIVSDYEIPHYCRHTFIAVNHERLENTMRIFVINPVITVKLRFIREEILIYLLEVFRKNVQYWVTTQDNNKDNEHANAKLLLYTLFLKFRIENDELLETRKIIKMLSKKTRKFYRLRFVR